MTTSPNQAPGGTTEKPGATPTRSLVASTARAIILWALVATLGLSAFGYLVVRERAERQALSNLSAHIGQRGRLESKAFRIAETNLEFFRERFLEAYTDPQAFADADFDDYYFTDEHGAIRLHLRYFEGVRDAFGVVRSGTSGFMGTKRPELTPELRRRMVIAYVLTAHHGPALKGEFANFHVSLPENALINHWPEEPWGLMADPHLDMTAGAVIRATLAHENPSRQPVWSGLYYDLTARKWAITYQLPVDHEGRHLINPSHDILLDEMVARLGADGMDGARNLILAPNGNLVAQPERMDEIMQKKGVLHVSQLGDHKMSLVYRLLSDRTGQASGVIDSPELDSYLAFARVEGPNWWYVTLYPKSRVAAEANQVAGLILLLGLALSLVITAIVLAVLRFRVARPIAMLKDASERVGAGDHAAVAGGDVVLPLTRNDEIGLLARSFQTMAVDVSDAADHLERTVAARTVELQLANRKLEQLSMLDGLTGAFNRRAFDRDIAETIERGRRQQRPFALLMCDIDHFKQYNDTYGHIAGDQVLGLLVSTIAQSVPDGRVYRYGGEELAVILDPAEIDCAVAAGHIIQRIAALRIPHRGSPFGVITLSAGLAFTSPDVATGERLLRAADRQLYLAKSNGRNRLAMLDDGGEGEASLAG